MYTLHMYEEVEHVMPTPDISKAHDMWSKNIYFEDNYKT